MYSASVVDTATVGCRELFHETVPPKTLKRKAVFDFLVVDTIGPVCVAPSDQGRTRRFASQCEAEVFRPLEVTEDTFDCSDVRLPWILHEASDFSNARRDIRACSYHRVH